MQGHRKLTMICCAAVLSLGLAACGGGGSDTAMEPPPPPPPTPYETAVANIAAAGTAEEAQAAYDAVKDDVTAAQGARLQAAVDSRVAMLTTAANAAMQRADLMTAAGNVDTSDLMDAADIAAANTAIAALKAAIAAAVDVDDTSMYDAQVTAAETAVAAAQSALDHAAQTMALADAVGGLQAIDLTDLSTEAKIEAANTAIAAVQAALEAATELSATEKTAAMTEVATASRTVMTAQGNFDTNAQKMALMDALNTLRAIDLTALMTQAQIDAAERAIIGLDQALAAATNLTDVEKLDATADVTLAKRWVARAQTALDTNVGNQRMALMTAGTALAALDLDDLDTQAKIDAADAAVDALQAALDGATHLSDSETAMYQTQLDTATETVRTAQTGMDRDGRMMAQRTAITSAVTMARTAVNGVKNTSTDSEVSAAEQAITDLEDAIAGAEDLPEGDTDVASAQGTLATLKAQLNTAMTARTAYLADKADKDMKAATKLGKDLYKALAGAATGTNALANVTASTLGTAGLGLTVADDAGTLTGAVTVPTLKASDAAVAALGGWAGTDYAHTDTGTKVVNEARVYTNQGPGKRVTFAKAGYTVATATTTTDVEGYLTLDVTDADTRGRIMAPAFTHAGEQRHTYDATTVTAFTTRGTYDGAPGVFRCVGTTTICSSTNDGKGSPISLAGDSWHFKPDAGAMVHRPDTEYLYYGWWVSKDKDGVPTAASAFVEVVEPSNGDLDTGGDLTALTGSATYAGHAAGKFAMDNPLDGTGSGGHFTADAELKATFGAGTTAGVTGTIDNFRLNDGTEDAGWSVSLARGALGSSGGTITAPTADPTVWSINGNKAPASGTWSGTMYDEMPGDAPDGDGSNIPTTVTGTFYSEFSTIGRMVGAFGAERQ